MSRALSDRRIVSVFFPALAMDRWRRISVQQRTLPADDAAIALTWDGPHGPVIHAMSSGARARGVSLGARVVDMQAIHPDLYTERGDPQGDLAFLDRLAHWARRWCPWTVADGRDGLILDVTGAAHLFGGESAMLRDIATRFAMQGMGARLAMAPSRMAAQALARFGARDTICGPADLADCLAPLPVTALRIEPDKARLLHRLGLKTIGALEAVPRVALMRRFAELAADRNPLILLDRAMGRAPDPLDAPPEPDRFMARARLAEPVIDPGPHLKGLAEALCADLARAERGARALRLTIYRIDGEWREIEVATARASRDPAHLLRLFNGKLEGVDPGFGFDLLTLEAGRCEPVSLIQDGIDGKRDAQADVAALLDRLSARLGPEKIRWSTFTESHKPEAVERGATALRTQPEAAPLPIRDRPLRLLERAEEVHVLYAVPEGPPSQFRWRGLRFSVVRHEGPERIAPEWWKDRPGTRLRDYYKAEVEDGRRFWLYREGVAGDGRGGAPRWFLHGFFA